MVVAAATTEATNLPVWMEWQDMDLDGGVMLADVGDMLQFELEPVSPVRVLGGFEITNLVLADLCVNPCLNCPPFCFTRVREGVGVRETEDSDWLVGFLFGYLQKSTIFRSRT